MTLYEVKNGQVGESYVRVYVWAKTVTIARELAWEKFIVTGYSVETIVEKAIFSEWTSQFCSEPSDTGFEL